MTGTGRTLLSKHSFRFFSNDVRWEKPLENSDFVVRRKRRKKGECVSAVAACELLLHCTSFPLPFREPNYGGYNALWHNASTLPLLLLPHPFFIAPLLPSVVTRPSMLWSGAFPPTHRRRKKKKEALLLIALHACLGGKNLTCTHLGRRTRDSLVISYSALRTV